MQTFFGAGFAEGGWTSVWVPEHLNTMWVRCPACGQMAAADREDGSSQCRCGAPLPEPPAYW